MTAEVSGVNVSLPEMLLARPSVISEESREPCRRGHVDQRQGRDRRPVGLNPLQAVIARSETELAKT